MCYEENYLLKILMELMQKQVGIRAKQCIACHEHRLDHIHVDLVGKLPPMNGFNHILPVVDLFTQWPEAIPLNDITSTGCGQALVAHWIDCFCISMDML